MMKRLSVDLSGERTNTLVQFGFKFINVLIIQSGYFYEFPNCLSLRGGKSLFYEKNEQKQKNDVKTDTSPAANKKTNW